jgi:hypothetical protein
MTFLLLLFFYLWIAPHVVQAAILGVMIHRKQYKQFPMFFLYTGFEILQFLTLLLVNYFRLMSHEHYHVLFSVGSAISTVIRFCIIYEILIHLFHNYPSLNRSGKILFRSAALILLVMAVVLSRGGYGAGAEHLRVVVSILDRTFSIVQCGLLLAMFLFSRYFGLSWRSSAFGIALGFGIFASVELASSAIRSQVGQSGNHFLDYFTMATYHLCVLIWLFYMLAPERRSKYNSENFPDEHDLDTWKQELQRLIQKKIK